MAKTTGATSYITTTLSKLLELGIPDNEPLNIRRKDIEHFAAKNLEKCLTSGISQTKVNEQEEGTQVQEFNFEDQQ